MQLRPQLSPHVSTFSLAFTQVMLISINTWQIANSKLIGAVVVGFLISLTWTFNVKKAAFGNMTTRLVYCSGAGLGTMAGLLFTKIIYK